MKTLFFSIFILSLTQVTAQAKGEFTCVKTPAKDKLTKSVNLIREMPPIRDQDSIGWCYSFAAADLLTHYLYKTKGKNVQGNNTLATNYLKKESSVSAMGLATMYNQTHNPDYTKHLKGRSSSELDSMNKKVVAEKGSIISSLENVKNNGFCLERDVSSSDFSYVSDQRCVEKGRCQILEVINIIYDSKDCETCKDYSPIKKIFPSLSIKDISKIILESSKQNALTNLVNATCFKKFKKNFPSNQPRFFSKTYKVATSEKQIFESVDKFLDRGIPVGIQYHSDFFFGKNTQLAKHASTLVGKTYNPKTCEVEYILRNSWGEGCGSFIQDNPKYRKCFTEAASISNKKEYNLKILNCKNTFKPIPRNPKIRCESPGYLYIQKSELGKNITSVAAILEDQIF